MNRKYMLLYETLLRAKWVEVGNYESGPSFFEPQLIIDLIGEVEKRKVSKKQRKEEIGK